MKCESCEKVARDKYFNEANPEDISSADRDEYDNPEGSEFDLAKNKIYDGKKILIGDFYGASYCSEMDFIEKCLNEKGFELTVVKLMEDYLNKLPEYDETWIISNSTFEGDQ
jgi:hypothetical protein